MTPFKSRGMYYLCLGWQKKKKDMDPKAPNSSWATTKRKKKPRSVGLSRKASLDARGGGGPDAALRLTGVGGVEKIGRRVEKGDGPGGWSKHSPGSDPLLRGRGLSNE